MIVLPTVSARNGGDSLEATITHRRSVRDYADRPVTVDQLARLLHFGTGITDPTRGFRAAPSAGALYPIEVYVVAFDVEGIKSGIYHYAVARHALALVQDGDFRQATYRAALFQPQMRVAALAFVLTGVPGRLAGKYGDRSERYMLLEAGHISENVYLEATALGLGCCAVGAFLDRNVNALVGADGSTEQSLLMLSLGPVVHP